MLVLLLKPVTFVVVTLWSLLTSLIFKTIACTIVLLVQGLKGFSEGSLGIFQQVAEGITVCFQFFLQLILNSLNSIISKVFDILKESITRSVAASGTVAAQLAEKLKTSIEEILKQVPQLFVELLNMMSRMVTELWNNYKGAVGYVTENT
ncbi:hypothetical protein Fmac_011230 [Flemingia macrophylla]|uniref:Uncharacterized protein n=1 Tax=Flemingia macrophylla TaxID=520843 RepID=A0ABD1MLY4_9FABA